MKNREKIPWYETTRNIAPTDFNDNASGDHSLGKTKRFRGSAERRRAVAEKHATEAIAALTRLAVRLS